MIRKTLIAAAATLALGFAVAPAQAAGGLYLGAPVVQQDNEADLFQNASHYVLKCRWKRVYRDYKWVRVKVCRKVYPKHYNSY
jgi:hypothetical protein